jgi:predicted enzyme related to lactoylglutathione lyase
VSRVRLSHVMLDALDPDTLATFWCGLLETEVSARVDAGRFVFLRPTDGMPAIGIQRVPEAKVTKNRVHVDLQVDDLESVTRWVRSHGGSRVADHRLGDFHWRVVADPEGNEFCLVPAREA